MLLLLALRLLAFMAAIKGDMQGHLKVIMRPVFFRTVLGKIKELIDRKSIPNN